MRRRDPKAVLRSVGWYPERNVADQVAAWEAARRESDGFVMHGRARTFRSEFGGLEWPPPHERTRRTVFAFELDPLIAVSEGRYFATAERELREDLYPAGEILSTNFFLAIGASGSFYALGDVDVRLADDAWALFADLIARHVASGRMR